MKLLHACLLLLSTMTARIDSEKTVSWVNKESGLSDLQLEPHAVSNPPKPVQFDVGFLSLLFSLQVESFWGQSRNLVCFGLWACGWKTHPIFSPQNWSGFGYEIFIYLFYLTRFFCLR